MTPAGFAGGMMGMRGGNQMRGFTQQEAAFYNQPMNNMGMAMPIVGGGRRRGGIQQKLRQNQQAAVMMAQQ